MAPDGRVVWGGDMAAVAGPLAPAPRTLVARAVLAGGSTGAGNGGLTHRDVVSICIFLVEKCTNSRPMHTQLSRQGNMPHPCMSPRLDEVQSLCLLPIIVRRVS